MLGGTVRGERECCHAGQVDTLLLWATRLAAIATLLPAFFVLWGLSGGDGTPRNPVAPLLGLGVMITSVWAVASSFGTLLDDPTRALAVFALPVGLYVVAWPFTGNGGMDRPGLVEHGRDAIWLSGPLLLGAAYVAL